MPEYTGVRYTALNPAALDKDGKLSPLSKLFATLRNENGSINYERIDKLAQGRRISEFKPSDVNWFMSTFQCVNCLLGGGDTVTTIGELAESMPNEHFAQFPVSLERISKILIDPQMGLLRRWVLNEDVSVAFVAPPETDVSQFINSKGLVDVVAQNGVITSGRHRLTAIMTFIEFGLGIPYSVYKNQRIRIRAFRFDTSIRIVEAVQAANFTRTMSTAETKNIQSQLVHGVGSTSDISKQLEIFVKPKAKSIDQKLALANAFRLTTEGDPVTDLTRFNIGSALYGALFSKDINQFGEKYETSRINPKDVNKTAVAHIIEVAAKEYQEALKGIANVARDGIKPSVERIVKLICKETKQKYDKPLCVSYVLSGEPSLKTVVNPVTVTEVKTVEKPAETTTTPRRNRVSKAVPDVVKAPEPTPDPTPTSTRRRVAKKS